MDLENLNVVKGAEAGFDLQLLHPGSGDPLGIFIHVQGSDSAAFQRLEAEQNRARLAKVWKNGRLHPEAYSEAASTADAVARYAAATTAWWEVLADGTKRDTLEVAGESIAWSVAAAAKLYAAHPWIREQVAGAVNDRGNFIQG